MASYSEKLRDPRWQKKRLEIMQRDDFKCQECSDATSTLHVHHTRYIKGREPWDYPNGFLVTLCELCHEHSHESSSVEMLLGSLYSRGATWYTFGAFSYVLDEAMPPGMKVSVAEWSEIFDLIEDRLKLLAAEKGA